MTDPAARVRTAWLLAILASFPSGQPAAEEVPDQAEHPLSADAAEHTNRRFDFLFGYVDGPNAESTSLELRYTQVFAEKHQLIVDTPFINADRDDGKGMRPGDIKIGYSYTPRQTISAAPWVPSGLGTGIGLSIPTGDADDGTGTGSYLLAPRLGFVSVLSSKVAVSPTVQYVFSFDEDSDAKKIRSGAVSAQFIYVSRGSLWGQWTPQYIYDDELNEGDLGNTFQVGRLFQQNLAISLEFARLPVFEETMSGSTTRFANSWTLALHVPLGYKNQNRD